jgi:hypothetical protein
VIALELLGAILLVAGSALVLWTVIQSDRAYAPQPPARVQHTPRLTILSDRRAA